MRTRDERKNQVTKSETQMLVYKSEFCKDQHMCYKYQLRTFVYFAMKQTLSFNALFVTYFLPERVAQY